MPLTADDHAILGGAWTLGGFVGGLLCGWISDTLFESKRTPPIVLFSVAQAAAFLLLYTFAPSISTAWLGVLVFLVSVFLLGNFTLLNYTVPADLPADVIATATGLITAIGYIATGLSGGLMGTCIARWGFSFWIASLLVASIGTALCTMVGTYFSHADPQDETLMPLQDSTSKSNIARSRTTSLVGVDLVVLAMEDEDSDCM
ncbi:Aste57867_3032 [Aphanomyces stellatus]|uniref:Aste57867_3032 protein n=1 Tax=Aphanomyces stellatus TaxID=120398 RepID=A0A485KAI8_9STRA|nr:hypothetical protein As57867_003023 [Aphanomyces stellatus]VFT80212.1 Aste57867_3032 [Aphanomyces stellatus]